MKCFLLLKNKLFSKRLHKANDIYIGATNAALNKLIES